MPNSGAKRLKKLEANNILHASAFQTSLSVEHFHTAIFYETHPWFWVGKIGEVSKGM
jgi:hypothetical protein